MNRTNTGIGPLLEAVCAHDSAGKTDGQLLKDFLARRDEAAFTALVRRHGPMVLAVCRRVLGNAADADDAFQATFIVLVRKAGSLTSRSFLGDWLHGVARHAALDATRAAARRRTKEQVMARPEMQADEVRNDWLPLLDQELSRLPEKYRLAIVLCDLEGKTRHEAAAQLGWPEGTVAGRLARARDLLAKRLLRGGQVSSGVLLGTVAGGATQAALPPGLVQTTVQAASLVASGKMTAQGVLSAKAIMLAQGVMQSMLLKKMKIAAFALLLAALLAGAGGMTFHLLADDGQPAQVREQGGKETPVVQGAKGDKKPLPTVNKRVLLFDEIIETKDFQQQLTLKEILGLLFDQFANQGKEVVILVDVEAFKEEDPDAPNIYETQVQFPPYPRKMSLATCLRLALAKVPTRNATFVVYPSHIEITTFKRASVDYKLKQRVLATFVNKKLSQALRELSEMTGTTIVIDNRVGDKEDRLVTATFLNDVDFAAAFRALTEMAELKFVVLKGGIVYVTTPAHAETLRKENLLHEEFKEPPAV
jgi:RNA polymerase sigma factor (sigma-70 family)